MMKKDICCCLIIRINGKAATVVFDGEYKPIPFSGEIYTNFDDSYWNQWKKQVSFKNGQEADICLVASDVQWTFPEEFEAKPVKPKNSHWKIEEISAALRAVSRHGEACEVYVEGRRVSVWGDSKHTRLNAGLLTDLLNYPQPAEEAEPEQEAVLLPQLQQIQPKPDVKENSISSKNTLTPMAAYYCELLDEDEKRARMN